MSNESRARGHARGGALSLQRKESQIQERQSAMADYDAARNAQRENMERLKTLRLARDAAEALRAPAAPKGRTKKTAAGG
jgi:hypothetical protein